MSIINLEKTFENEQLVYCNLDNKIIECTCLSELSKYDEYYDNENLGTFICDKIKVIAIYDIYKNIIYEPIKTNLFKDPIKISGILEDLIGHIYFFKTFIGAFIINNKLNGIQYYTDCKGFIYKSVYDNIELIIIGSIKTFNIYDNEGILIHQLTNKKKFPIYYKNYNDKFEYTIYDNYIEIMKEEFPFYQTIYRYTKKLKFFQIGKMYHKYILNIYETRNDNNEIEYLAKEYVDSYIMKALYSSCNKNPPFSKQLGRICIELIDCYKKNINNCIEFINHCLKKEKIIYHNLLLNCKLEMIDFT